MSKLTYSSFNIYNLLLLLLIVIAFININEIFSILENKSNTNTNLMKLQSSTSQNQSIDNNTKNKFFYLKTNNMLIPLNFFANYENLINNVIYEKEKNSLLLILNPINSNNNIITIQLPRSIIDSKTQDNKDNNFTVLLDNKPSKYLELDDKKFPGKVSNLENSINTKDNIVNSNDRVLSIKFDKDTKVIKISGTDTSKNQNQNQIQKTLQGIFPILIENKIAFLKFYIEGGYLKEIGLEQHTTKNKTIELFLNPYNINGSITIQLPRSIIDSKTQDNKDNNFTVLLDNKPSKYLELDDKKFPGKVSNLENSINTKDNIVNSNDRVLSIKFDKDTKVIKISGTDTSKNQNQNQIQNHPSIDEIYFKVIIIFFLIATPLLIYFFCRKKRTSFTDFFKFKINKNKREK